VLANARQKRLTLASNVCLLKSRFVNIRGGKVKSKRVAIYARVSTAEQDPDTQLYALREYARHRGFEVHREYIDRITGIIEKRNTKSNNKNSTYQNLMTDVRRRQVDCVLVWKYDRFARSLSTLIAVLQEFSCLGVDFISYTQNIDTTTPMGRLFFHIIGSFAEFEREQIVERVRAGLEKAKAKGVILGRPERDPDAKARILELRRKGLSLRKIAEIEKLSAAGVLKILRRKEHKDAQKHLLQQINAMTIL
jgi:DNA invertase Pin-like site-specific DNA recombinase